MQINKASYLVSSPDWEKCPPADRPEYAAKSRTRRLQKDRRHEIYPFSGNRCTAAIRRRQAGTSADSTTAACS